MLSGYTIIPTGLLAPRSPDPAPGRRVRPRLRLLACMLFPSVLTHGSQIRVVRERGAHSSVGGQRLEGRRKRRDGSLDGAGWWESCVGLCGDFGDREDAGRWLHLPLLRDLACFSPCLVAPGGSGQSLLAPGKSVVGSVAWGQAAGSR